MITANPARKCAAIGLVTDVEAVCRDHVRIEFELKDFPRSEAGQFLQVLTAIEAETSGHVLEWRDGRFPSSLSSEFGCRQAYLRRPFSIADRRRTADGRDRLAILSRAIGPGTRRLDGLFRGDAINVTGPLGRGFRIPCDSRPLVLIGGGVGIPPLLYLSRMLAEQSRQFVLILGAMTRELLPVRVVSDAPADGTPTPCVQIPGAPECRAIITTDDGSLGVKGRVTVGLAGWARRSDQASAESGARLTPLVLACGPSAMLAAISTATRDLGFGCQLCIERYMGCGMGTCLSCVTRVRDETRPIGWRWALACTEGPVFDRDQLVDGC
ncbi:MAG: hypothetical protein U1D55_19140 [Phycisphaerae bacterium]